MSTLSYWGLSFWELEKQGELTDKGGRENIILTPWERP